MLQNVSVKTKSNPEKIILLFIRSTFLLLTLLAVTITHAADIGKTLSFPSKTIKIIIPAAAGGLLDKEARVIAPFLEKQLKVSVSIEDVIGASGILAYNKFYKEKPDGYTMLYFSPSSAISYELIRETAKYVVKNYAPIAAYNTKSFTLLHLGTWKTFSEFVNDAKQRKLTLAGTGGSADIQSRLLEEALGTKFNWVSYGSSMEAFTAVAGKHVDVVLASPTPALSMIRAGKLKPLAVFSPTRDPSLPGVPTVKELGRNDIICLLQRGVFAAPPGTPKEIIAIMEKAIDRAIADPEAARVFDNSGIAVDFKSSAELSKLILEDYEFFNKYKEYIK